MSRTTASEFECLALRPGVSVSSGLLAMICETLMAWTDEMRSPDLSKAKSTDEKLGSSLKGV